MENSEVQVVANAGDMKWTTPPSPVNMDEKIAADEAVAAQAARGDGPSATNEPH